MAKKTVATIKLQIPAGSATPAPPVGPALSQYGLNILEFCKEFNARTQSQSGLIIPVVITAYADRSFAFVTKTGDVGSGAADRRTEDARSEDARSERNGFRCGDAHDHGDRAQHGTACRTIESNLTIPKPIRQKTFGIWILTSDIPRRGEGL